MGGNGIRANAVVLGIIRTDRSQIAPERRAVFAPATPVKRVGDQMDVARAILFLASDMSSYTTGHSIPVDGGVLNNYPLPRLEGFTAPEGYLERDAKLLGMPPPTFGRSVPTA